MLVEGPPCCANGIRGYGNVEHGIMLLGIAPGRDEMVNTKRPFTGPTGKLMDQILEGCGWPRSKCYCTNSICWWKDDPTEEELEVCRPRLQREIELVKPRLIVALGTIVCQHMLGMKLTKVRGATVWSDKFQAWVMPVNHPAAILNSLNDKPQVAQDTLCTLVRDFKKLRAYAPPVHIEQMFSYQVLTTKQEAQETLSALPTDQIVTLDIETEQKETEQVDAFVYDLECLAIYDGEHASVLPRNILAGLNWPMDVRWCFHNGLFDTAGLHRYLGVDLSIIEDTMLMSYSLEERSGFHGLKNLAREYCGAGFWEEDKTEGLFKYNALDAYYTYQLWHVLRGMQEEEGVTGVYSDILIPGFNMLRDTHVAGVPIDRKVINELVLEWAPKWMYKEQQLKEMAVSLGYPGKLNIGSSQQLGKFLFGTLGLPIKKYTKGGNPSVDAEVLENLDHPFVDGLHDYRQLTHMLKSYLLGVSDDIKYDNLLHPLPKMHGTITGRLSYSAPPIQTIPQDYSVGELAVLRKMFTALPDHVIMEADYCLDPSTPVLKADLTWVPIDEIELGDELIGFDEDLAIAKYKGSIVESKTTFEADVYQITTNKGVTIATADHGWVVRPLTQSNRRWKKTSELSIGDRISFIHTPWQVDTSYDAGYISGFMDGEGFVSNTTLGWGQNDGEVTDHVLALLSSKGFQFTSGEYNKGSKCKQYRLSGQKSTFAFLGIYRPRRLLAKARKVWEGRQTWGKNNQPAFVFEVKKLPNKQRVVGIQTTTKTFIANGMLSHNSQIEIWMGAGFSGDQRMLADLTEPFEVGGVPNYHSRVARDILGGDPATSKDVWGAVRNRAKRVTFGIMYLIGAGLLANARTGIGCTVDEARSYIRKWYQRYPDFERWQQETIREGRENGELTTPFGRKRRIHAAISPRIDPQLANFKIQSTASDYTLTSAIKLNRMLKEFNAYIMFLVHDSIVIMCPSVYLREVAQLVKSVMTEKKVQSLPSVPIEMKVGPNWFEVEKYEIPSASVLQ